MPHCTEIMTELPLRWGRKTRSLGAACVLWLAVSLWPTCVLAQQVQDQTQKQALNQQQEEQQEQTPAPDSGPNGSNKGVSRPLYQSHIKRDMQLLAEGVPQPSVIWLGDPEEQFLVLYEEDLTGEPVGAILILHAEGQHSSWPDTIEQVRTNLPEFGWNTLSTTLPDPPLPPIPERTLPAGGAATPPLDTNNASPPVAAAAGEDDEIFDDSRGALGDGSLSPEPIAGAADETKTETSTQEQATTRIQAAIRYLHEKGQFNIVLMGDGIGAIRASCYLKKLFPTPDSDQLKPIRAMVMLNARNQLPGSKQSLPGCLYDATLPTLDIYFGLDHRDHPDADERLKYSRRSKFLLYQQIHLPEIAHHTSQGENRLSRRIRGFLEKHAKGVKLENAIVRKR